MGEKQKAVVVEGSVIREGQVCGIALLDGKGIEVKEAGEDELNLNKDSSVPDTFRQVHDYAAKNGFVSGYPTFDDEKRYSGKRQVVLFKEGSADFRELHQSEFHHPMDKENMILTLRVSYEYACWQNKFGFGFPTFHISGAKGEHVFGTTIIDSRNVTFKKVPVADLAPELFHEDWNLYNDGYIAFRLRNAHQYGTKNGHLGAMPNFHQWVPESELFHKFGHLNHLLEEEGWKVVRVQSLAQPSGDNGQTSATLFILEK